MPVVSVVIPAHNEAAVITRCLDALTAGQAGEQIEIIVVCNGCSDQTAALARRYPRVEVREISQASKTAALNEGDRHRSDLPVAYVDADIEVSAEHLLAAAAGLNPPDTLVVSPKLEVDAKQSNWLVKAFYGVWLRLPYLADKRMVGSGVYILSREGRARFGQFPQVIADDGYVRSLFKPQERLTVEAATFRIFAPRNLAALIRIKTRVRLGNLEVKQKFPSQNLGGENKPQAFSELLFRKPWLIPAGCVYAFVQWCTALNAKKQLELGDFVGWERDETSRS